MITLTEIELVIPMGVDGPFEGYPSYNLEVPKSVRGEFESDKPVAQGSFHYFGRAVMPPCMGMQYHGRFFITDVVIYKDGKTVRCCGKWSSCGQVIVSEANKK